MIIIAVAVFNIITIITYLFFTLGVLSLMAHGDAKGSVYMSIFSILSSIFNYLINIIWIMQFGYIGMAIHIVLTIIALSVPILIIISNVKWLKEFKERSKLDAIKQKEIYDRLVSKSNLDKFPS